MSFKIKCPECGTKMSIIGTGRHGHWNCCCTKYEECAVIGCNVCIDGSGCDECLYRDNDDGEDECEVDWGDRLCSGKDYCDKWIWASEDCAFEEDGSLTQTPCRDAYLCTNFFFHPIWKRLIHCPSCGSFDVNTLDDNNVWKFRCLSCNEQFELSNKNQNNNNDVKQKLIEQEEEKIALLKKYKELLDSGILSEAEFEHKKKEVLEIFK